VGLGTVVGGSEWTELGDDANGSMLSSSRCRCGTVWSVVDRRLCS